MLADVVKMPVDETLYRAGQFSGVDGLGNRPLVLRKFAADWPLVTAARQGHTATLATLRTLVSSANVNVMIATPETAGRFFYSDDMRGFNFTLETLPLSKVIDLLEVACERDPPPAIYAGASAIATHAPQFLDEHAIPLALTDTTPRIWIGNASRVATHYDLSDNVAVVAAGRRRFTLFPPHTTPDLYVGPLGFTIAGQPVSMVDPLNPDMVRFPRYARAADHALVADLEPGDAIFIPTLWWHHVQAFGPVNVLVNYWHNNPPTGQPFNAFLHAMLGIRDLPPEQRAAWRVWFDHFVFGNESATAADHIPAHARGIQASPSGERSEAIQQYLMARLNKG